MQTKSSKNYEFSYEKGLDENPTHVVFNGAEGTLTRNPLVAKVGERVRIFVGNAGPNLVSSFHVIGAIFDRVYREGDLISPPARSIQTTLVPAGGAAIVEIDCVVPGSLTLVDHSIFRMEKGCVGFLKILGEQRKDIWAAADLPVFCPGCKLH
jgi:FtsP/CotA-like multicopper oxidase with cupredoxin domain